ncbi:MAG: hypothetical protein GWM87_13730 [Xanthomonadales bacterium]|nr:SoxR reducing system RseC family protein [Xanthomonadales bacterium]NIX13875.1 hypothetical protein [Xanthomonadales bacterium]
MQVGHGSARVSVGGQGGCTACDAGRGCGAGLFGRLLRRKPFELELPNKVGATAGQAVTLGMPESLFMRLVLRLYGWPLLAALTGGWLGYLGGQYLQYGRLATDALTLLGMAGAAALVILPLRHHNIRLSAGDVRILSGAANSECNPAG